MQDALTTIQRRKSELTADTKLGGGYAALDQQGQQAVRRNAIAQINDVGKAIDSLVDADREEPRLLQNADQAGADSLKKLNGKS